MTTRFAQNTQNRLNQAYHPAPRNETQAAMFRHIQEANQRAAEHEERMRARTARAQNAFQRNAEEVRRQVNVFTQMRPEDQPVYNEIVDSILHHRSYTQKLNRLLKAYAKSPLVVDTINAGIDEAITTHNATNRRANARVIPLLTPRNATFVDATKAKLYKNALAQRVNRSVTNGFYTINLNRASVAFPVPGPNSNLEHRAGESGYSLTFNRNRLLALENQQAIYNKLVASIDDIFRTIVQKNNLQPRDRIIFRLSTGHYRNQDQFRRVQNFSAEQFIKSIEQQLQSWQQAEVDAPLDIQIFFYRVPQGAGSTLSVPMLKDFQNKTSMIMITNDSDSMCAARAGFVAMIDMLYKENDSKANYNKWQNVIQQPSEKYKQGSKSQREGAENICAALGKDTHDDPFDLADIKRMEDHLKLSICIVDYDNNNSRLYEGTNVYPKKVYFLKQGNHFHYIKSIKGYFATSYFCEPCFVAYSHKEKHCCPTNFSCNSCHQAKINHHNVRNENPETKYEKYIPCHDCNYTFPLQACFDHHITSGLCGRRWKCLKCKRTFDYKVAENRDNHVCGHDKCPNCKEYVDIKDHLCYQQPLKEEDTFELEKDNYVFFDFETYCDENAVHQVNLAKSAYADVTKPLVTHYTIQEFCDWALIKEHNNFTFIAHNGRGYDFHPILKYMHENNLTPFTIFAQGKITYMSLEGKGMNIRFVDSLSFISTALREFPKMFGIKELKKGFFPHHFNLPQNQDYVDSYPPREYYDPDSMMEETRTEFNTWYEQVSSSQFDFKKEFHAYCESDVLLLRDGCKRFQQITYEVAHLDPFKSVTLASCAMKINKKNFLQPNTIAYVSNPQLKHENYSNLSIAAIQTLTNNSTNIKHAQNGGEQTIDGYKVDGYDPTSDTVYQFHGCFWHGCPKCTNKNKLNPYSGKSFSELYSSTQAISATLKKKHKLVEIWECDYNKMIKDDKNFSQLHQINILKAKETNAIGYLNPRKAFFGGRTDVAKLYHKCSSDEKIYYYDFTSLYPTVCKYGWYPKGHHTTIYQPNTTDISSYKGLIYCDVLPPRGLRFPVLPVKDGASIDKLVFPLCSSCAANSCASCTHSPAEREITGTWTHLELNKAIEKGYKILKIHEVHHFEEGIEGLFADYVNTWLKIKAECSGFPSHCVTEEQKQDFIETYYEKEGIRLDYDKIIPNKGMRSVSKLFLNSLWGKFGQRPNMVQNKLFNSYTEFINFTEDSTREILDCHIVAEQLVNVSFRLKSDYVQEDKNTNIYVAIFTTSQARLMLYDKLDLLQDRVLYYDTDSIVFVDSISDPVQMETGDYLGLMKKELEYDKELECDNYITEFVATGPKSYAYTTFNGKEDCVKLKGFTLNHINSKSINMKTMLDMIKSEGKTEAEVAVTHFQITKDHSIKTVKNTKKFKFCYDKQVIDWETYKLYPFGY